MKNFSLGVIIVAVLAALFFILSPAKNIYRDHFWRISLKAHHPVNIILDSARMTSTGAIQIETHKAVDDIKNATQEETGFFISNDKNGTYVMLKNSNILARSSTGAMVPYSGKIEDDVHENVLCPDVGVGVGYKISRHVAINAAYDGAFLTMADEGHYDKNINAVGAGLTIGF